MADPFVFVPEASDTHPYNPFFSTPSNPNSPFIPPGTPLPLSAAGSPFPSPSVLPGSAPGSPGTFNQWHTPLGFSPRLAPPTRQRTTSWHASAPATGSPFLSAAPAPAFVQKQSLSTATAAAAGPPFGRHQRASSWGGAPLSPAWLTPGSGAVDPWAAAAVSPLPNQTHPFLNAAAPATAHTFYFDLAPNKFAPMRLRRHDQQQQQLLAQPTTAGAGVPLSEAEMREPAFHPPRTALRILHPALPFWPIDLAVPESVQQSASAPAPAPFPPIALGDVLVALHRALHARIGHDDWAALSPEDEAAVNHAFTRRCRREAAASTDGVPAADWKEREAAERNEGVKRVDFLKGKTVFKGLVRDATDPEGVLRLVTA